MTTQEKSEICQLTASLFSPPDRALAELIHSGALFSFFESHIQLDNERVLSGFVTQASPETLLSLLASTYERLFSSERGEPISLVESHYKPWTQDASCALSFASSKGLLMGDSAAHLSDIYLACRLEVSEEFRGCPDHIVLELEFLAFLYGSGRELEAKRFTQDHLGWLPALKEKVLKREPYPFYTCLIEILEAFLDREKEVPEIQD